MWQRFTERARKTVFYAQEAAVRAKESFVGSEHLLIGLLRETDSISGKLLTETGVDLDALRTAANQSLTPGEKQGVDLQLTAEAKRVIDYSYDEARTLQDNFIGTHHMLLGMLREQSFPAAKLLMAHGASRQAMLVKVQELRDRGEYDALERQPLPKKSPVVDMGKNESASAVDKLLQLAIRTDGDKIHWTFDADSVNAEVTQAGAVKMAVPFSPHLEADIRQYFVDWAHFSGAGDLFSAHHPVRLAYSHLGRNYDLTLTQELDSSLWLSIAQV